MSFPLLSEPTRRVLACLGDFFPFLGSLPHKRLCFHQSSMGIHKGMSSFLPKPRLIPVPRIFFPGHIICPASCSGSGLSINLKSEPPQGSLCGLACTASILMITYDFLLVSCLFSSTRITSPTREGTLPSLWNTAFPESLSSVWCLEDFQ